MLPKVNSNVQQFSSLSLSGCWNYKREPPGPPGSILERAKIARGSGCLGYISPLQGSGRLVGSLLGNAQRKKSHCVQEDAHA